MLVTMSDKEIIRDVVDRSLTTLDGHTAPEYI